MARHAETVFRLTDAAAGPGLAHALSWRRCLRVHRLDPERPCAPRRLSAGELAAALDRAGPVVAAAEAEMDRLFETVGRAGYCVVLTDAEGVALGRRGLSGDARDLDRLGLVAGAVWDEAGVGTNAIGTALAEKRAVSIHRDKHFLTANTGLSCATAPIRDARGRLAGALDVSSCRFDTSEAMLAVLLGAAREAAARIETALFRDAHPGARIVLGPGAGGRQGLLAVNADDLVVGANAAARAALGLDDAALARQPSAAAALGDAAGPSDFDEAERRTIRAALSACGGNATAAARRLGVSRTTLHRKVKRLGLG